MAQPRTTWELNPEATRFTWWNPEATPFTWWNPEATPFEPHFPHISEYPTPEEILSLQQLAYSPISEATTPRSTSNNTPVQNVATPRQHPVHWLDEELARWGDAYSEIGDDDHAANNTPPTPPPSPQRQQQLRQQPPPQPPQPQQQLLRDPQQEYLINLIPIPIRRKKCFIRRKSIFFPPKSD
ncbi:uncharacterized protein SEPMUDRAFT_113657 [Sphaerulina musiva SO2202]|uniref:Uncharacterized protein n=1 Tax=Sphaerulina musiva (strain SO2202) TaxID=692275 RepID=N1QMS4_SPHMS|nr:uncharacterized protein SEPMUDRAFT_113657 [Sphaerulina musiva SO2202]EMF17667.1 hypothetical protein SEPMUDRAFT_113657 [Sphaerulina musiva SO2202]